MKKLIAVSAAALFLAACGETPLPTSASARSITPSAAFGVATTGETYNFEFGTADASPFTPQTIGTIPSDTYNNGGKGYLGPFYNSTVTMATQGSGTDYLNLSLYVEGSWDGNAHGRFGGDSWTINAYCGTAATGTPAYSFTTNFINKSNGSQAYPGQVGATNDGLTGSTDLDELGFAPNSIKKTNRATSAYDAVYKMSFAFPSCGGTDVTWTFTGAGIGNGEDEFWGVDNLSVGAANATAQNTH